MEFLLAKATNPIYSCQLSPFPKSSNLLAYGTENLLVVAGISFFLKTQAETVLITRCLNLKLLLTTNTNHLTELVVDARAIKQLKSFQVMKLRIFCYM